MNIKEAKETVAVTQPVEKVEERVFEQTTLPKLEPTKSVVVPEPLQELPRLQQETTKPSINLEIPEENDDDDFFDDFFDN